ncbi:aldo/keto reductase [Halopiger xanaduensis]|uniref:2,5-didehydrogluconate reductase n=1 Tax=Halopiger xanaduensis (strain DSM 18323 / JCM 14033 / SH-6) TaxID=797210 RepID=F8D5J5_HALXS|nr:aldo/keto reductase [Halopiger xanaduensis]AEH38831.1 2,5-didehydrogluconate reductase [Halopiger xanaduensis SH-6]
MSDAPITTETVSVQGAEIPVLGFGTARMTGDECRQAVETALEVGYRHVDTAQMYDNERAVGEAIANSAVDREDVFVVTKVHPDNAAYDDVLETTRESLERLGLSTVDLLLLHAPSDRAPLEETVDAMNELQAAGAVDHIGVSNFSVGQLEDAIALSETPIVANQVKYHPYHHRDDLLEYCVENDVCLTAYSPLAEGAVPGDDRLVEIGADYDKSAAQVALRWLLQQPSVAPIPKAASREHIEANADVFDFELDDEEMAAVTEVGDGVWNRLAAKLGLR